jgi:hypothetical protein
MKEQEIQNEVRQKRKQSTNSKKKSKTPEAMRKNIVTNSAEMKTQNLEQQKWQ